MPKAKKHYSTNQNGADPILALITGANQKRDRRIRKPAGYAGGLSPGLRKNLPW
jgi:hypothetical protein